MSKITADDVRKVAKLSRLNLPEETIATYTGQLERILDYVDQLQAVDTEGVPPTTRAVEVVNVTREDAVVSTDVREELLDQAPQREGDFFRVPKILAD
ncbi:Asp-tRNA(Asn)/Glu-tRNA(Gln) amidotransferase subunit GatC [Synechococcus sp. RS9916]|uniref:Asp-tRNA(Asn)/Glu-tRNA(Gln) amidotransferase subunit GatC n=1 Tax=Synechococcus sp. RS9916 TaxID=221359 RepID=UPI0000E54788|nr:Asp-tRNA(Asn)/Glu-tRNA(Gln) amidotransferase subunit GatC [Synechococcus sp. RS9916]EAU72717.1 glutamyl-tRNA (Gln) amidotransferase subunit C [Synechococcus sp. RS9916]